MTGAMIKVPEDQPNQSEELVVEIFGNFMQTNMAQNRIRTFVSQGMSSPVSGNGNGAGNNGNGHMSNGRPPRR